MVERGIFYKQFDAGVDGGSTGKVIPFRRPWEQEPTEPQPIDLMTELLQWDREAEARELGAVAPADYMYARLNNVGNLAFRSGDRQSHARMRDIIRAYETLALDAFSTITVDDNSFSYKDEAISSYSTMQRPYVEEKGVRLGGVTLSHEDATMLQWSLEHVGIPFDPGEGDTCIPFTNIHNELQYHAKFRPEQMNPVTVENAYALAKVPIMQGAIINLEEYQHPQAG